MHWSVRWLLLSFAFSCLMRVSSAQSADQLNLPFTCNEQKSFFDCSAGKWTGVYDFSVLDRSLGPLTKEAHCCALINGPCYIVQYAKEKCEKEPEFDKWISGKYDAARKECNKLKVNWSNDMCAKEEDKLQPLREDCKQYEKWIKCPDPAKVLSGGIALTTNWINWLIVMMTVIVVKYCI